MLLDDDEEEEEGEGDGGEGEGEGEGSQPTANGRRRGGGQRRGAEEVEEGGDRGSRVVGHNNTYQILREGRGTQGKSS